METINYNSINSGSISNSKKSLTSKVLSYLSLDYGLHFIMGDTKKIS